MVKFMRANKVVILLNGRYAGKKAVIVKNFDEGDKGHRHYGYAVVAGVARAPLKVTRSMSQKRIAKRSKLKPFVKIVNYNHLMPTRYALDVDLKSVVDREAIDDAGQRTAMRKEVKKLFEERHKSGVPLLSLNNSLANTNWNEPSTLMNILHLME